MSNSKEYIIDSIYFDKGGLGSRQRALQEARQKENTISINEREAKRLEYLMLHAKSIKQVYFSLVVFLNKSSKLDC